MEETFTRKPVLLDCGMAIEKTKELRLKFVRADKVLLHEQTDPQRVKRLRVAVEADGVLRNPPITAEAGDVFVVLDGATRTTVLKEMGATDILVQVVPYDDSEVRLQAWYHILPDHAAREVMDYVRAHTDIAHSVGIEDARKALDNRTAAAAILNDDGSTILVDDHRVKGQGNGGIAPLQSISERLRSLVSVYGGTGEVFRIVHDDLVETVQQAEKCPSVVMFPSFTPEEIVTIATTGGVLPAGITRHLIPGRALNVNLALERIMSEQSLAEKNLWLQEWLTAKIMQKKVRYYHEPVFVFDD